MDVDDDSDLYSPEASGSPQREVPSAAAADVKPDAPVDVDEDDESEDSDSDIDIITERKDGSKPVPPSQSRYNNIRDAPQRNPASDASSTKQTPAAAKKDAPKEISSGELPAVSTSKIDVDARPIYEPAGKPITEVNIDDDLPENDKPWRRPGTDITDYFNYGFDEFTWALYTSKQQNVRAEFDPEKIADSNKKMMEEMNMMMASMAGMPGLPGAAGGMPMPGMPGADGMPAEMQAMLQQMMSSGMDPTQMDPSMFAAMQSGQGGQQPGQGGGQGQGFGGQQGFGQGQNSFGFDQNMNSNRNNFRGRGRGRNW